MWIVKLAGEASDLATLAQSLTENDINISQDGQDYVLTSDQFAESDNAKEIRRKAETLVTILNGASRLAFDAINSIGFSAAYRQREDGKRDMYIFVEPAVTRFRAFAPSVKLTHADGTVEEFHPADPVRQWVGVASQNGSVTKVLCILASGILDWVNLYRIVEIIVSEVGSCDAIYEMGWTTKATMRLFKHTANSPGVLGIEARHGTETTQPPKNPMTISEARSVVNAIIHAWLRSMST